MGNSSSFCPGIGLLRCDCGYEHGCVESDNNNGLPLREPRLPPSKPIPRLPPPRFGKLITMLSIDGGGIRGLIPAVVIERLEEKLQAIDKNKDARIADYFDVIAGTSTGALIATMLVVPDEHKRPLYATKDIKKFYLDYGPSIFPQKWWAPPLVRVFWGPRYDGAFLQEKIKNLTEEKTLADTLSNLVVPTFDVNTMQPIIFSSFKEHLQNPQKMASHIKSYLSDVCIGTSAAPTFFPAHHFDNFRSDGSLRSFFHLIDGGVVANNPTMTAITKVTYEVLHKNPDFHPKMNYKNFLVISVGTGSVVKEDGLYTAEGCAKWSALKWVRNSGHNPIIDIFSQASAVLVDLHVCMLLCNTDQPEQKQNYLRIEAQAPLFGPDMLQMDNADPKNMDALVDIGMNLLDENVASVDLYLGRYLNPKTDKNMGRYQPETDGKKTTNDDELERFAKLLSAERKLRLRNEQNKPLLTRLKSLLSYITQSSWPSSMSPLALSQMTQGEEMPPDEDNPPLNEPQAQEMPQHENVPQDEDFPPQYEENDGMGPIHPEVTLI